MILEKSVIKPLLPYVGTMMIILGYLKLSIFYKHFNININNYLEISEVLTLFLSDIIYYGITLLILILFDFFTNSKEEVFRKEELKTDMLETSSLKLRLKKYYRFMWVYFWITGFSIISGVVLFFVSRDDFYDKFFVLVLFPIYLLFFILLFEFKYKYKILYNKETNKTVYNLVILLFLFTMYIIPSSYSQIKKVENENNQTISFTYLKENLQTDKTLIFLGQTKNYLFTYNKEKKESFVYNRSDIKDFKVQPRKDD